MASNTDSGSAINSDASDSHSKPSEVNPTNFLSADNAQHLPIKRYIYALVLVAIAVIQSWLWAMMAPPSANPFSYGAPLLSTAWWLEAAETNAPLKLTVIDTNEPTQSIKLIKNADDDGNLLFIQFDGQQHATLDKAGDMHEIKNPQTLSNATLEEVFNIDFLDGNTQFSKDARRSLNAAVGFINNYRSSPETGNSSYPSDQARQENGKPDAIIELSALVGQINKGGDKRVQYAMNSVQEYLQKQYIENIYPSAEPPRRIRLFKDDPSAIRIRIKVMPDRVAIRKPSEPPKSKTIRWRDKKKSFDFFQEGRWRASKEGLIQYSHSPNSWETIAATRSVLNSYFEEDNTNWENLVPRQYAPPLSILIAILLGGCGALLLIIPPTAKVSKNSNIEDFFVTDAPINSLEFDKLNFGPIAKSLSQFLRNERTTPPLTVAITGQWGSGKSSLMSLLKSDLEKYRLRPIWVNAWHHQNESQFLAGLLERIRNEALPPTFSAANVIFQLNLLWIRIKRNPLRVAAASSLLLVPLGYWIATGVDIIPTIGDNLKLNSMVKDGSPLVSTGVSLFLFFRLFGSKISSITGNTWFRRLLGLDRKGLDLRSMVGLREKFVSEFGDICEALSPTTLTIFVDDLDRCNEKRILDILETSNFLISNGNCYIALGMEKEPVEKAIANYYRGTHSDFSEELLLAKSKRYLEKLVNIEVPVPETNSSQSAALTHSSPGVKAKDKKAIQLRTSLLCVLTASILLWTGYYIGQTISPQDILQKAGQTNSITDTPQKPNSTSTETLRTGENGNRENTMGGSVNTKKMIPKEVTHFSHPLLISFLIFFALVCYVVYERIMQRKHAVITDTETFETALEQWGKAVGDSRPTPRRIKRFINRTRYLAMRRNNSESTLSEDELVTLAGIYEIDSDLLSSELIESSEVIIDQLREACTEEHLEPLQRLISASCNPENQEAINKFKYWVGGIALR